MAAKNDKPISQLTKKDIFAMRGNDDLLTYSEAASFLGLESQGALGARLNSHSDIFRDRVIRRKDHPTLTDTNLIYKSALVESQAAVGNRASSRDGAKWYTARLSDEEAKELALYASDVYGREIVFEQPTERAKRLAAEKTAATKNGHATAEIEMEESTESVES